MIPKLEIETVANIDLRSQLLAAIGRNVKFSNGCWLSLKDDEGMFWGDTPYGIIWGCNSDDDWLDSVLTWLSYWDEDRDEAGRLIQTRYPLDPDISACKK